MALFGLGNGLMSVLSLSLIADTVGRQERGLANGMRLTFMRLGSSTGPVIFGYLAGITSVASAFFGIGAVGLGVGLFLSASRFVRGTGLKTEGPRDS